MRRVLALAFVSALGFAADPATLTIVSSLPRTGSANAQTSTIVNGIRLAIEQAGGAVGGTTIVYHDWDDASPERGQWDPAVETANANKAVADASVVAYLGTYNSGAAKIAMPILNQAGLVMISPANTAVGLTRPVPERNEPAVYRPTGKVTYFRVVPGDWMQGELGAQWAKELGATSVFVLHDKEVYGKGLADVFVPAAEKLGLKVSGVEGIDPKAQNYRSLVTKIRQTGAQLVYFAGTAQSNAGQVAKDLAAGGLAKLPLLMPDGCFESALLESGGGKALDGRAFLTFGGLPPEQLTGAGAEFVKAYEARFQGKPQAYAVYGYECARVVLDAIRRANAKGGATRASVLAEVAATKDFQGVLGTWSFDDQGDTTLRLMSGNTVKDGQFVFVKLLGQ
jgi:branched-chain amino acid transport system substrate-binding protein